MSGVSPTRAPEARIEPRPIDDSDLPTGPPRGSGILSGCSLGCLSFIALALLFPTAEPVTERMLERPEVSEPPAVTLAVCGLPIVLGILGGLLQRRLLARRRRRREIDRRRRHAREDAWRRSERARWIWAEAGPIAAELPRLASLADGALDEAERAFDERVFSPFWDRVRETAEHLAKLQVAIETLSRLEAEYRQILADQAHSFPEKLLGGIALPAVGPSIARLGSLTHRGQQDFEFAMIWEHHKTRQILVEGFSTLEDAIEALETSLERSIERCADQLSLDLAATSWRVSSAVEEAAENLSESVDGIERRLEGRLGDERGEG